MTASGVSALNEVSELNAFDVFELIRCKVTKMQSFLDLTIKIYFR